MGTALVSRCIKKDISYAYGRQTKVFRQPGTDGFACREVTYIIMRSWNNVCIDRHTSYENDRESLLSFVEVRGPLFLQVFQPFKGFG